jgi:hypothetical protein
MKHARYKFFCPPQNRPPPINSKRTTAIFVVTDLISPLCDRFACSVARSFVRDVPNMGRCLRWGVARRGHFWVEMGGEKQQQHRLRRQH